LPRHARRPPRRTRPLDRALGVSRRRRQVAYLTIGAGFRMLQPAVRRVGVGALTLAVATPVLLRAVS